MEFVDLRLGICVYVYVAVVVQSLPTIASLNTSLYMVYSGFQDYFFGLYDGPYTPGQALDIVGDVVDAIVTLVEVSSTETS